MPRTMTQERITLLFREDLIEQAKAESASSTLTMAELFRRALDQYLNQFPAPAQYETGEQLPEGETSPPTITKKVPFHINPGLLGEADRYAHQINSNTDEVANRALLLYFACLEQRRQAAELIEQSNPEPGQVQSQSQAQDGSEPELDYSADDVSEQDDAEHPTDEPEAATL